MPIIERLISLIAPHDCLVCDTEGSLLCAWCLPDAITPVPSRCYRCKKITQDFATCVSCRRKSPLRHVWVATEYEAIAKELIHKLKFDHAPAAAKPMSDLMAQSLPYVQEDTLIVHIPTATSRRRQRGFDHAELLAKYLSVNLMLRHASLLHRSGQTRQVGAKRKTRLQQLTGAYRVKRPYIVKGADIIIVDDITTTGATIEAAARALKLAGARSVSAVVFAQKQ